jgi:heme/copper-type cytochrome/quinol oxidase subunit 2
LAAIVADTVAAVVAEPMAEEATEMDNGLAFALIMIGAFFVFALGYFVFSVIEHVRESKKSAAGGK